MSNANEHYDDHAEEEKKNDLAKLRWFAAADLTLEGKGFADTEAPFDRLPRSAKAEVPEGVWEFSKHSTGMCVRFVTDAPEITIRCVTSYTQTAYHSTTRGYAAGCDIYGRLPNGKWNHINQQAPEKTPAGYTVMENTGTWLWQPGREGLIYFPARSTVDVFEIGVAPEYSVRPAGKRANGVEKPVVHYGTSIVHGGCASRSGMMFTAIYGRLADVPVVNLGFSGRAHLDFGLIAPMAEIDASLYIIDCVWNLGVETLTERLEKFVRDLHARRPRTPILLCDGCGCDLIDRSDHHPHPLLEDNAVVKAVFAKLRSEADFSPVLHHLPADNMLPQDGDATVDHCHPNDYGMMHMGRCFADKVKAILGI